MKKILVLILLAFCTIMVNAQEWEKFHQEGDELLGLQELDGMVFTTDECSFVFWDTIEDDFLLISPSMFNYETGAYSGGAGGGERVYGIVGIYDSEGKLLKKYDNFVFETVKGVTYQVHPNKYSHMGGNNKKNAKKIINYINRSNGVVRFVLPLYNTTAKFDLKVKCLGELGMKFE